LTAVEEREDGIKDALEAADKAKAEMQALNADNERILTQARIERDALLKEARDIKDKIVNDAKEQANSEADKILTSAKEQINNEKLKAITELKNTVATLSIDIAEKVLRSELSDKQKQEDLVENALKETELN
jgi:F-type H+-transporting ATPase subunit b